MLWGYYFIVDIKYQYFKHIALLLQFD